MHLTLVDDVRYAVRGLIRRPSFAVTAILTMAVGIGAATAIFSVAYATLLRPLPYKEPGRLMFLHLESPSQRQPGALQPMVWSYPKYELLRQMQRSFEDTATFRQQTFTLTDGVQAERVYGEVTGPSYFALLGIAPSLGVDFPALEKERPRSALIGHGLWVRRFGGDPSIIGRPLTVNGEQYSISGVLPAGFQGLTAVAEIWLPVWTLSAGDRGAPLAHNHAVIGRLRRDVSSRQAADEIASLGPRIDAIYPWTGDGRWGAFAQPLNDARLDTSLRRAVLLLSCAAGCLLLMACANLASLLLARAVERRREMAVRLAIGASAGRLTRQLLTESTVIGLFGAAAGMLLAGWGVRLLGRLAAATAPEALRARAADLTTIGLGRVSIDGASLAFAIAVAIVTSLAFGIAPALQGSRTDLASAMKRGAEAWRIGSTWNSRFMLVVVQLSLTFALLAGAGLLFRSFDRLQRAPIGFDASQVMTARLALPLSGVPQPESAARAGAFFAGLDARLRSISAVTAVAVSSCVPFSLTCEGTSAFRPELSSDPSDSTSVGLQYVSGDYFSVLRIPLLQGRAFDARDGVSAPTAVIVNAAAAQTFWPGENPVGRRLHIHQPSEVIGVVADIRSEGPATRPRPEVYLAFAQSGRTTGFVSVRASLDPVAAAAAVRDAVRTVDPGVPVFDIRPMQDRVDKATARERWSMTTLVVFAVLALAVAGVGIFGLFSFLVECRSKEIAIRVALGAKTAHVVASVAIPAGRLVGIGIAGGLALTVAASDLVRSMLYGIEPLDPVTIGGLPLVLAVLAICACCMPVRRALRVDPIRLLRTE